MTSSRITRSVAVIDDDDTTDNFTADEDEIPSDEMELISGSDESEDDDISSCNKKRKIEIKDSSGKNSQSFTFGSSRWPLLLESPVSYTHL